MKYFQKGDLVEITMFGSKFYKKQGLVLNRRHALETGFAKTPDWLKNPEDWGMIQYGPDEYYCTVYFSDPPEFYVHKNIMEIRAKWLRLLSSAEKS